ncbi:hypothetical protein AVL50_07395 [Flammeovirga sp. SJP92]|nr:hypothetical protein AVL50_07395 [Flammeovirga sp. SJP92]
MYNFIESKVEITILSSDLINDYQSIDLLSPKLFEPEPISFDDIDSRALIVIYYRNKEYDEIVLDRNSCFYYQGYYYKINPKLLIWLMSVAPLNDSSFEYFTDQQVNNLKYKLNFMID